MYENGNGKTKRQQPPVVMGERPYPQSREAEEAVLGSILIDPDAIYQVSDVVQVEDFHIGANRDLYRAMLEASDRGDVIDILATVNAVSAAGADHDSMMVKCLGLMNIVPTSFNARMYAEIVAEKATRRRMIHAAGKMASLAWDESGDIGDQMAEAEADIFQVRGDSDGDGVMTARQYTSEFLQDLERIEKGGEPVGLATGFVDLDRVMGRLEAPNQYILAARPAMGKSALAGKIALNAALSGKVVMFFSLEMSPKQLQRRMYAEMTGIPALKIKEWTGLTDAERTKVYEAMGKLSDTRLIIDKSQNLKPADILARAQRVHAQHGLDLIVVDYLNYLEPDKDEGGRNNNVGQIVKKLSQFGKPLNCPVLTLAQLNRGVESRANKRPMLSDLRDSGEIEQFAYAVMFLYRDDYYDENSVAPNRCEVIIAKNKEGETGTIELYWKPELASFRNLQTREVNL